MTVAEMNISNKERLSKLETLDPKTLNDILDNVFSKYFRVSDKEKKNDITEKEKGWADEFFGIWNDMPDEIINEILTSRTRK